MRLYSLVIRRCFTASGVSRIGLSEANHINRLPGAAAGKKIGKTGVAKLHFVSLVPNVVRCGGQSRTNYSVGNGASSARTMTIQLYLRIEACPNSRHRPYTKYSAYRRILQSRQTDLRRSVCVGHLSSYRIGRRCKATMSSAGSGSHRSVTRDRPAARHSSRSARQTPKKPFSMIARLFG